ncbi:hypothetical protein [Enterococcus gilvus]|uniref:hypothetical protein n=1 Tax=Enterococcus gilvus TaxID=160453 RepID=UPI003ED8FE56
MTLEFNATLRDKGLGNDDKKKILLEVPVSELKGKVEELTSFANKTVTIQVVPQYYTYSIPFDKSTNAPTQEYVVNNDGTIDFVEKEQTQLEVDEQGNIDIENRPFEVTKEIVDEFIRAARSLEFPGAINPRDVLCRSEDGEPFEEIASDYDMAELSLINELESAREYYAPYAAAWDKKRNEVIFQDKQTESADSESSESDNEEPKGETANQSEENSNGSEVETEPENEQRENEDSESDEQSVDEDPEDDPYK